MRFTLVSLFALSAFTFVAASPSGLSSDATIRSASDETGSTQLDLDSTATPAIVYILTNASAMIAPLVDQLSFAQQGDSPVESIAPIISNIKEVLSGTVSQLESLPPTTISERDLGLGDIIKALTSLLDVRTHKLQPSHACMRLMYWIAHVAYFEPPRRFT
ncbi:hypothetical protein BV22DRAFT_594370 [Leucogyrophana mollusca]|uniref:Uncharacterized protein n=1 Tax=Leucogyrophana mollusca TaxID=85980 RepID=A0ACB8BD14_9AGAM|nr:hypothetical protein BV22DRAFT_594370 [Leucogyrophana mollusca]